MKASYDIESMTLLKTTEDESSDEETVRNRFVSKLKKLNLFNNSRKVKKVKPHELPEAPTGYWELSSDHLQAALSLSPMLTRSVSLQNISACSQESQDSFKSIDNLTAFEDEPKSVNCQYATVHRKRLQRMEGRPRHCSNVTILVLGNSQVGKSALIQRYVHDTYDVESANSTKSQYNIKRVNLWNQDECILHIYDIGGDAFDELPVEPLFGAIVVYDVNNPSSFASVKIWKRLLDAQTSKILPSPIPCVLFANKCDAISSTFERKVVNKFSANRGFTAWFGTSAKINFNVKSGFEYLLRRILYLQRQANQPTLSLPRKAKIEPPKEHTNEDDFQTSL